MKKTIKAICAVLIAAMCLSGFACNKKIDNRTDAQKTVDSIACVDALGRVTLGGEDKSQRDVGLFYFLWLGAHATNGIYDISDLEENNPDALWSVKDSQSPLNTYHFWGEPLYGYYNSNDPWVITRHIELFTMAGIDFLVFDTTNAVTYETVVKTIFEVLEKYRKQGFDVPKVAFMTNSNTKQTVNALYNYFYAPNAEIRYPELWYSPNGKPLILGNSIYYDEQNSEDKKILDFFELKDTDWPNDSFDDTENGFPWMSWNYPQPNFNGIMSVSVAQHVSSMMSKKDSNWGRGYSDLDYLNSIDRVDIGSNFQMQWNTALNTLKDKDVENDVTTAFLTGWNEWIAIKFANADGVYFVDQFNEEYSRDIEMMKGGYGDNYYLQMLKNTREFKYNAQSKTKAVKSTPSGFDGWEKAQKYVDFEGDAMKRDYNGYSAAVGKLTDNTNRNDIVAVKATNDNKYAYFLIECADNITEYVPSDKNYMNIWIKNGTDKVGYDYVINREMGKVSAIGANGYKNVSDAEVTISGNKMIVKVSLSAIGLNAKDTSFMFKVSDNVDSSDVMNFYIQGDSAPIGRLNYSYGYIK